jgi:hypothetical protein
MPDNFSGTWTANLPKSTLRTTPPAAIIARIKHEEPELEEELVVTKADGSESRAVFRCRTDRDHTKTQLNGNPIRGGARWEEHALVIETWLPLASREMHFCDRWSLSADGQTLTMEHREGDLAGQRTVFDRTG